MNMKSLPLVLIVLVVAVVGGIFAFNLWSQDKQMNEEDMGNQAVDQSHRSYELELTSNIEGIEPQKQTTISYKIKNDKGNVLKNYEVVHEKIMHFIVVRRDLQNFLHLHPEFNKASGEFTVNVNFPSHGPYRIFPDFTSGDDNPRKLPATVFADLNVGEIKNYKAQGVIADKQPSKTFGEYKIDYSFPGLLEQQKEANYSLIINKDDQPVTNLEQYLGALGHSVILKADTLDFIHTHATSGTMVNMPDMPGMDHSTESISTGMNMGEKGSEIKFATTFPSSGTYKIFTQFQHEEKVITTDFTVEVD